MRWRRRPLESSTKNERATEQSLRFQDAALLQTHPDGFFVEGGGYDSSYNGVATALAYRIASFTASRSILSAANRSLAWQLTRILPSGEIVTKGNARVRNDGTGETFLGRHKDVDVGHTLEAIAMATAFGEIKESEADKRSAALVNFYRSK